MRGWLAALVGAVLLAWVPSAGAQDSAEFEELELRVGLDSLDFIVRESMTGIDASEVRQDIDEDLGNGDGHVTIDEVERYRAQALTLPSDQPECFEGTGFVLIDGQPPRRLSRLSGDVVGALGPVSSQTTVVEIFQISFLYPNATERSAEVAVDFMRMGEMGGAIGCVVGQAVGTPGPFYWGGETTYYGPPPGCCADSDEGLVPELARPDLGTVQRDQDQQQDGAEALDDRLILRAAPGMSIDRDSIRPVAMQQYWDGSGIVADTDGGYEALAVQPVTFTVHDQAPPTNVLGEASSPMVAVSGAIGATAMLAAVFAMTEYGRWLLIKWLLWWPGFSRLEKDEVLQHDRRSALYAYIKENPGASFTELKEHTELANGTLVHHLRILENQEFIRPIRDGFRTRFYMRGPRIQPEPYLSRTQRDLLDLIQANPGLTQKELSRLAGLPRESVSYHARRLVDHGKLEVKPDGKWRRYFMPPSTGSGATP